MPSALNMRQHKIHPERSGMERIRISHHHQQEERSAMVDNPNNGVMTCSGSGGTNSRTILAIVPRATILHTRNLKFHFRLLRRVVISVFHQTFRRMRS